MCTLFLGGRYIPFILKENLSEERILNIVCETIFYAFSYKKMDFSISITWNKKSMTVSRPIQECRLYIFGCGQTSPCVFGSLQGARLCESNTAFKAIIVNRKTEIIIPAWINFNFRFRSLRNMRYMRIPKTKEKFWQFMV